MTTQKKKTRSLIEFAVNRRQQISTLLFLILATIATLVLLGLIVISIRLAQIQSELAVLRDNSLPRLVKLAQLSQESIASISIAPALSTNPTRFEFETLLSRITDKERSQKNLISELRKLTENPESTELLEKNSSLLAENQNNLTNVVRQQIDVRKRLENHIEYFQRISRNLSTPGEDSDSPGQVVGLANSNIFRILSTLLDSNEARFSRNWRAIDQGIASLDREMANRILLPDTNDDNLIDTISQFRRYWSSQKQRIFDDKKSQLANEFKIKALVEENSLIANRLLSRANTEFVRASSKLTSHIQRVEATTRFTLIAMGMVVLSFFLGSLFIGYFLRQRIFQRLDRMRTAVRAYAENRDRSYFDPLPDEIGEISDAFIEYMDVIDQREFDLAQKSKSLEQLSNKLSKYLSPQVYASIFEGKQDVKVNSSRKKLTVFFSDIADFTETADRLESEELTLLLNQYLTEMSEIALNYGATIDKYVGDAIMVFFGDPETKGVKQDALACVKMAIAMRDRLRDLDESWRQSGVENTLICRMGIHTGYCTVGNFGSEDRMDYTIIGSAVNRASRLEALAEPGQILISFETYAHVKHEIYCEEHGQIEVRGVAYPIQTYFVIDSFQNLDKKRHQFKEDNPAMKIDLDIDAMTAKERNYAAKTLQRALDQLEEYNSRNSLPSTNSPIDDKNSN